MKRLGWFVFAGTAGLILLRLAAGNFTGPWWGINVFHYQPTAAAVSWTVAGLIALLPPLFKWSIPLRWEMKGKPWPAWLIGLLAYLFALIHPAVGTPLLGDGIDRIEATLAGLRSLRGQPAPLDLLLHVLTFSARDWPGADPFLKAWAAWRFWSHLAGGLAAAFLWKLAALRGENRGERAFVFFTILAAGSALFFFGYVENYVALAAAIYGYLALFESVAQRKAPVWSLFAVLIVLIGLHYFMVLLLPPTLFALSRHRLFRPGAGFLAIMAVLLAGFAALVLYIVRAHYGGIAAIFVQPADWFGIHHLIGFLNQQLLASPTLLLLAPLVWLGRKPAGPVPPDPLATFTAAATLTLLAFFFFLRPVLGPAADWDLFAIPSLLYTPWLALRVLRSWRSKPVFPALGWAAMVLATVSVGPWLSINVPEAASIARFKDLMEWEAGHNSWAASYGYLRLGKYLERRPWERQNPEIVGSLTRAVQINPDSATLRLQVAQTLSAIGRDDLARPQMVLHFRLRGEDDLQKKKFAAAAEDFAKALELAPASPKILEALIKLYEGPLRDPAKAAAYRRRLAETQGHPPPH